MSSPENESEPSWVFDVKKWCPYFFMHYVKSKEEEEEEINYAEREKRGEKGKKKQKGKRKMMTL